MFKIIMKADKMSLTVLKTQICSLTFSTAKLFQIFFFTTMLKADELNTTQHLFNSQQ